MLIPNIPCCNSRIYASALRTFKYERLLSRNLYSIPHFVLYSNYGCASIYFISHLCIYWSISGKLFVGNIDIFLNVGFSVFLLYLYSSCECSSCRVLNSSHSLSAYCAWPSLEGLFERQHHDFTLQSLSQKIRDISKKLVNIPLCILVCCSHSVSCFPFYNTFVTFRVTDLFWCACWSEFNCNGTTKAIDSFTIDLTNRVGQMLASGLYHQFVYLGCWPPGK